MHIVCVLPALLGTYGDIGNAVVLERRLAWRGIPVTVTSSTVEDPLPRLGDLYVLGGGEDWAQEVALSRLQNVAGSWLLEGQAPVLAVCAGLQILGQQLPHPDGSLRAGLALTDVSTIRGGARAVGEVKACTHLGLEDPYVSGFANHAGLTVLGSGVRPFGTVVEGPGNRGAGDTAEGVLDRALVGSYLHGPLLARNPQLADQLLARAVGHALPDLPPGPEQLLHAERLGREARR